MLYKRIEDLYIDNQDKEFIHRCKECYIVPTFYIVINYHQCYSQFYCIKHIFEELKCRIMPLHTIDIPSELRLVIYNYMLCDEFVEFNQYHYIESKINNRKYFNYQQYLDRYKLQHI